MNPETNEYLELDVYIPSLSLGFEYQVLTLVYFYSSFFAKGDFVQERHHYTTSEYTDRPLQDIKKRDAIKLQLCKDKGITLIIVPCWWDGSEFR